MRRHRKPPPAAADRGRIGSALPRRLPVRIERKPPTTQPVIADGVPVLVQSPVAHTIHNHEQPHEAAFGLLEDACPRRLDSAPGRTRHERVHAVAAMIFLDEEGNPRHPGLRLPRRRHAAGTLAQGAPGPAGQEIEREHISKCYFSSCATRRPIAFTDVEGDSERARSVAPAFSRILNNSVNRLSGGRNPYRVISGKTRITIRLGTAWFGRRVDHAPCCLRLVPLPSGRSPSCLTGHSISHAPQPAGDRLPPAYPLPLARQHQKRRLEPAGRPRSRRQPRHQKPRHLLRHHETPEH